MATTHPPRQDSAYDANEKDSIEQIERNPQHPEIIVDEKVHDPGSWRACALRPFRSSYVLDVGARFAAAKIAGKLDPWSRASFTMYACALMAFLCSMGNGYDGSYVSFLALVLVKHRMS